MPPRAHIKGWPVIYNGRVWVWEDSRIPAAAEERPCRRCGKKSTIEGYDACIGFIKGITSACCGHGVQEPFAM